VGSEDGFARLSIWAGKFKPPDAERKIRTEGDGFYLVVERAASESGNYPCCKTTCSGSRTFADLSSQCPVKDAPDLLSTGYRA